MRAKASTTRLLLTELADFVRKSLKDYPFPSPDGSWLDCRVFLHWLPEEMDGGTYPYVVVRWLEGEIISADDAKTELQDAVALILGVHSPRSQAEAGLLCAELLDVLRRSLWKQRILAGRFELVEPLRSSMPGVKQQVHKFHLATIETVWNYIWPPKALEEAGISQTAGDASLDAYSVPILENMSNYKRG